MRPSAVDVHFLKHREAHTVVDVTGLCDFIGSIRFLFTELVAGETQHRQTLCGVLLIEHFEACYCGVNPQ